MILIYSIHIKLFSGRDNASFFSEMNERDKRGVVIGLVTWLHERT